MPDDDFKAAADTADLHYRITALQLADGFEKHHSAGAPPEVVVQRAAAYLAFLKGAASAVTVPADDDPF